MGVVQGVQRRSSWVAVNRVDRQGDSDESTNRLDASGRGQRGDPNHGTGVGSFDPLGRTDRDTNVTDLSRVLGGEGEDQVAGLDGRRLPVDGHTQLRLSQALVRQLDANRRLTRLGQTRAVVGRRTRRGEHVRLTHLSSGEFDHLLNHRRRRRIRSGNGGRRGGRTRNRRRCRPASRQRDHLTGDDHARTSELVRGQESRQRHLRLRGDE